MLIKSTTAINVPGLFNEDESYHIRNVVRVHLIQVLVIDVRIGKVKPVEHRHAVKCKAHSPLWVFTANLTNIVNDLILTPAPGLRCWAGGPGMYGSDTADSCPSRMFSEPTPQPGCAVTHTNTHRGNKCTFKPLKQHYSCFFSFLFKHSCVFLLFVLESHIQAHG